jgi:TPR repeat protein
MRVIAIIRIAAIAGAIAAFVSSDAAKSQSPNERARCLSIADVDSRVDCLENLRGRVQTAPSPMRRISPQEDRELDCRNPRDIPLCREYERQQGIRNDRPQPPTRRFHQQRKWGLYRTDCDTYAASPVDPERKSGGIPFEKINPNLAIPACESAVRQYPNSSRLIYQLGRAYQKNNNFSAALVQYQKAADQGNANAQYNLGVMYANGQGVAKDDAQAASWYRKAAEQGSALAQNNLGSMYRYGLGVTQNNAEAVKWYRKPADQGNAGAQFNLGVMYEKGQGVQQNYAEAVKWYRMAGDQGNANAQNNLGAMYASGQGVAKDYALAIAWFREAAEQGFASAQFILGIMYEDGVGITKDEAQAAAWYRKAAEQGDDDAKKKLAELQATKQCEQLAASTAYVVATCVVGGMEQSRKLEGLQSAKAQVEHAQAGLDCTPEARNNLQRKSNRSAAEILNSGAITTLMDFADAMNLECKKAAASILKSD